MCGIAGFLDGDNSRTLAELQWLAGAMADRLAHRGPDDRGTWADPSSGIALGHRRLSILDLSPAGHQPMRSASGRFVIAFNGEVYNYLALRDELREGPGIHFDLRGHSDTEVILAAFERWGVEKSLPRLEGMFAIAAWDCQERVLWLVRDRFGKKPLYYGHCGRSLLFASELKAFRAHPEFRAEIDPDAVAAYFRFGYVPAPLSIYRGVRKLPAASWLRISSRTLSLSGQDCLPHQYWSLGKQVRSGLASPFPGSDEEAIQELDDRLRRAVRQRMMTSDVPVGLFLSGGVDSATVTALAQAQSSIPIRTFSIGMTSAGHDESGFAAAIARHLGTSHTALMLTASEAMSALRGIPAIYDEPFADSSAIPTLLVSRLARRQVTVALSGDGGDEMFGGYNRHVMAASAWPIVRSIPRLLRRPLARALGSAGAAHVLMCRAQGMVPSRFRQANLADKAHKIACALDAGDSLDLYLRLISYSPQPVSGASPSRLSEWIPPAAPAWLGQEWLGEKLVATSMMLADARLYMHDDILVKVDRASMAASLEVRNPFLDARVAELACALPLSLKIRDGVGKWIVRKVMDRYIPRQLTARPKMGFAIPLTSWLRGPLRDWAEGLLGADELYAGGWVDRQAAAAMWAEFLAGRDALADRVWCLLMFQAWRETERAPSAALLQGQSINTGVASPFRR
jgi:asparagine synthase (glutamine-hydrolysing)